MTGQQGNTRPRLVEAVRGTCQPRKAEPEKDLRVDATFDEADSVLARTVAIHQDGGPRREG